MTEINDYFREKKKTKKREELTAWRDYYLQGEITWGELKKALDSNDRDVKIPIINTWKAVGANMQLERL